MISNRKLLIFDMDGVILDSLENLSNCLVESVAKFCISDKVYQAFKEFDLGNPGISRFDKVNYFLNLQKDVSDYKRDTVYSSILEEFDKLSLQARLNSKIDDAIFHFGTLPQNYNSILLSNCDNQQLKIISAQFGLHKVFANKLVGTPPSKEIGMQEIISDNVASKTYSISDSESDAVIARGNELDFVFIEKFARDNGNWCQKNELKFKNLSDFCSTLKS
jgi:phosphoglycolate phosphatase-like HAD superfamily hydrolase